MSQIPQRDKIVKDGIKSQRVYFKIKGYARQLCKNWAEYFAVSFAM